MKNTILIIGDYKTKRADTCKWNENIKNLTDYNIIIIDTNSLYKMLTLSFSGNYEIKQWTQLIKSIETNFKYICNKIKECILIDIQIYILFLPQSRLRYNPNSWTDYSLYTNGWFPISLQTTIENGTTVITENKKYSKYINRLKEWKYYYLPKTKDEDAEIRTFYKQDIFIERKAIATNKLNKPLALELITYLIEKNTQKYIEKGSRIILLPITNCEDISGDIDEIISLTKSIEHLEVPEWTKDIVLPYEITYRKELETAEKDLIKAREKYNNLILHKKLLFDFSYSLQDICESTLRELGAKIKPSLVSDEFIIEYNDKEALIEVKGSNKSIIKDDIGQLITDIGQHIAETGNSIKGILIGNGWRNLTLEEREKKKVFPSEIVKIAQMQNIGLLSTTELFFTYCNYLDGKLSKEKVLETIFTSAGIIKVIS